MSRKSEAIDIRWMPQAKACWHAVQTQQRTTRMHCERVQEKRDRYEVNTIQWAMANTELRMWEQIEFILRANLEGKTVSQ